MNRRFAVTLDVVKGRKLSELDGFADHPESAVRIVDFDTTSAREVKV
jgi:hypothetical protein